MLAGGQWKVKTQSGTSSFRNNCDNNDNNNNTKTGRNKNRVKMSEYSSNQDFDRILLDWNDQFWNDQKYLYFFVIGTRW